MKSPDQLRHIAVLGHIISLSLLLGIIAYLFFLGGWGVIYGLLAAPLAVLSALCIWTERTKKYAAAAFFSTLLVYIGLIGGAGALWDNLYKNGHWDWGYGFFLLVPAPCISICRIKTWESVFAASVVGIFVFFLFISSTG